MSETPRMNHAYKWGDILDEGKQLERDLTACRAELAIEQRDRLQAQNEVVQIAGRNAELQQQLAAVTRERDAEREHTGQQLAACSCAAIMDTAESHEQAKIERDNPFWSPAYEDVMRRTAECIDLRAKLAASEAALEKAEREVARLREALKPMADRAGFEGHSGSASNWHSIAAWYANRAMEALAAGGEK